MKFFTIVFILIDLAFLVSVSACFVLLLGLPLKQILNAKKIKQGKGQHSKWNLPTTLDQNLLHAKFLNTTCIFKTNFWDLCWPCLLDLHSIDFYGCSFPVKHRAEELSDGNFYQSAGLFIRRTEFDR